MNEKKVISIISKISEVKKSMGLEIIDSHIHPLDVMGVAHYEDITQEYKKNNYLKPGILEKLNFGKTEKIGSKLFFNLFPNQVNNIIKNTFNNVCREKIIKEMDVALIDRSIIVPIEPWLPTKIVAEKFSSKRFAMLGSVDIHNINSSEIENTLQNFIDCYKIIGIKLHPNLQNFKPQPKDNFPEIAEKLHKIYKFAEAKSLYILLHGGISHYTQYTDVKYGSIQRSRNNAMLENFCDINGKSELFENYKMPIVIAHLGHYGIIKPNYNLMKLIAKKFENVYFDTTGASPHFIKTVLELLSSHKIIFGSDAIYNRMAYGLAFLYLAAENVRNGEDIEIILSNTLCKNLLKVIFFS